MRMRKRSIPRRIDRPRPRRRFGRRTGAVPPNRPGPERLRPAHTSASDHRHRPAVGHGPEAITLVDDGP